MKLSNFDIPAFVQDHWQKKPLMIPNPWEAWRNPLSADELAGVLSDVAPTECLPTLADAVAVAAATAQPGDKVLLSPACASFDMFDDYVARGEAFTALVAALQSEVGQ